MELFHLKLKRLVAANYRSIKRLELDHLDNMVWLVGRNNAGKSNLLDAFQFLSDASTSFEHALAGRGGDLVQVLRHKQPHLKMEFVFDFELAAEKRGELVRQLFAENPRTTAEQALASPFLSLLTLKVGIGRDLVTEELTAANLRGERPCLVFSIKSAPKRTDITYGQLEALCKRCKDELPSEPVVPELPPEPSEPFRLRLGRPESGAAFPVSNELADGVRRQFTALEWAAPPRPTPSGEGHERALAAEASDLPEMLHWVYNNKPSQFRRIEALVQKLVPRLGKLHTPTVRNETTLALIDPRDEDLVYSLGQMSVGTRSLVALVSKVLLAAPGAWICVEEPEYCLHPQAQGRLMQFLRAESVHKRIFGATHAPGLAAACPLSSLFVLRRDADNCTTAAAVTAENAGAVIEELGVGATFSLERDAVVFVEEADQVPVFEAWARTHGIGTGVQFLSCDGADNLRYHANSRVALSRQVRTLVFAVFGGASAAARQTLARHLELAEDQVVTLDYPELEGCLLNAKAIRKAFPAIPLSEAELQARLDPARVSAEQKRALRELLAEYKIGDYDGQLGGRIAEAMDSVPADVARLFGRIEAQAKAFWEI